MRFDKYTLKAQESLQETQAVAEKREHQQIEPEHLLIALLQQNEGIVPQVFQKLGASIPNTLSQLDEALGKIPKVYGSGMGIESSSTPPSNFVIPLGLNACKTMR